MLDFLPDIGRNPSYGLTTNVNFDPTVVRYGGGYEQRQEKDLSPDLRTWSVSWNNLKPDQYDILHTFLRERKAVYAFLWKIPDTDEVVKVFCTSLSDDHARFHSKNLSTKFREGR